MSSELDKLVEIVTDLVVAELGRHAEASGAAPPSKPAKGKSGPGVLVCPGPRSVQEAYWGVLASEDLAPTTLVWSDFRADQMIGPCAAWKVEARNGHWDRVVSGYRALILLGCDLSVLAGIGNLGSGSVPPASAAVAALEAGLPVFADNSHFEQVRRHSSRLASGLVRRFEEFYRMVNSFGVEFGGAAQLPDFLRRLGSPTVQVSGNRSEGRAVVTVEDVEAVRRAAGKRLTVAIGTIVTPLASQRASEWGIEVVFQ